MNNTITLKIQADKLIRMALEEDVSSEDVTTCAVIEPDRQARADLLCKQDGIIAGLSDIGSGSKGGVSLRRWRHSL